MRLSSITFHNFGPFRGTHTIDLDAGVFAVVAKHEDDEERSNWLGKTTWLYGLAPFLLLGVKPPSARTEDDWITDGEAEGYIEATFDNGLYVKRSRKRGKSTQLQVNTATGGKDLTKGPAQEYIEQMLGMSKDDFFNSSFFEQKKMDKFITVRPSDRMEIAAAWFNLGPLQSCEDNLRKRLNGVLDQDEELCKRREVLQESAQEAFDNLGLDEPTPEKVEKLRVELQAELDENRALFKELSSSAKKLSEWQSKAEDAERYDEVVKEGKELAAECASYDEKKIRAAIDKLNKKATKLHADAELAQRELAKARELAESGFDGACPVTGADCPVREDVDASVREADDRIEELEKKATDTGVAATSASKRVTAKQQEQYEVRDKLNRLELKREQARKLLPAHKLIKKKGKPPGEDETESKLEEAQLLAEQGAAAVARVESAIKNLAKWEKEVKSIASKRKKLEAKIQTHREALVIVGLNGAQRRRAERSLAQIERDANALLNESGIDLAINVMWSREASSGMASACDQCGAPYPRSTKVKVCHKCGASRPKKTIDKLDIELSDHSGAAEDLAGVAFQLAAAAWLRRERATDWSVAFIDEPFSHLDAAHVKRLSTHFAAMLKGRYGFEQSFVVAHDRGIMDALPGRVEIVASGEGSSFGN